MHKLSRSVDIDADTTGGAAVTARWVPVPLITAFVLLVAVAGAAPARCPSDFPVDCGNICCPSDFPVCASQGSCCTSDFPVGCGKICCPSDFPVCGSQGSCCASGSTVDCGADIGCCPTGMVCTACPLNVTLCTVNGQCPCVGDCNGDGRVTVDEILTMAKIALGSAPCSACDAATCPMTIDQIIKAVNNALKGCLTPIPTPTATPSSTLIPTPTATPTPVNLTGIWSGTWTSNGEGGSGNVTLTFTQTGSRLSGQGIITGSTSASGTLSGSLSGNIFTASITSGGTTVLHVTGSVTGNQMTGTYDNLVTNDKGTFAVSKGSCAAPTVNMSGTWHGNYQSTAGNGSGTVTFASLSQAQNAPAVRGGFAITGSTCFSTATLSGEVCGRSFTAFFTYGASGGLLTGTVTGTPGAYQILNGTYTRAAGGCGTGDTGDSGTYSVSWSSAS